MKYCVHTICLEEKEFMVAGEIFKGFLTAIAALALFSVFLIPEENTFIQLGYSPVMRCYLAATLLIISLDIFGVLAFKKSRAWCRSCKKVGKPLCFCGMPLLVENNYHVEHFLFVTVCSGLVGKCSSCDVSFPIGHQQNFFSRHCWR